jgi:dynein heavy chain
MMEAARRSGDWVCLQNCHLAVSWLPRLEQILEQTSGTDEHPEYRLWLTSMPSPKFPVPVLQNGIKLTQEPPRGLKANLKRTFLDMTEASYEGCEKPRPYKKLLFGLAFYHALILERRKFGAIGWNIPYEWMNSDLKTGMMQLKMYLEEQPTVPYETLNAVVGDITYGGRATDAWDKRTNLSVLRKFFCPEVMEDGYAFSDSGTYYAPAEGSLEEVLAYIDSLPLDDAPETFGLHDNAAITLQQKESNELMTTIVSIQPRTGGGGGGKSPDEIVGEFAVEVAEKLPGTFNKADAHPSTFATIEDGSVNSLGVFAEQEMVRFNRLITVMRSSLVELQKAIKGLVVMSPELEEMYGCFLFKRVPPQWENAAYPSLKPLGSWVDDLFLRLAVLDRWLKHGPPSCFWISGFFFPQGFMTGALQTHSRKTKIAIDTLAFRTEILPVGEDAVTEPPENGVYIYGLYLQGCRWSEDKDLLIESKPGELFYRMPCIWLDPIVDAGEELDAVYNCPVYKTSRRAGTLSTTGHSTNFIVTLQVPTDQSPDHWVRRGVAMLCQLDD